MKTETEKPNNETVRTDAVVVSKETKVEKKSAKLFHLIGKPVFWAPVLLVIIAGGWFAYSKLAPHDIKIGSTVITKKDISNYGDELTSYSKSQNVNFGDSPQKVAQDDLILNAALKDQAAKYHVTVTQSYIDSTLNKKYQAFGSKASYDYFIKQKNIATLTKIRNENTAYESKLEDQVIGKRSYFIVGITYDSPYFNTAKDNDKAQLWDQATQTIKTKFLPLFKAGESEDQIAAQADFNTLVPNNNASSDISVFFHSAPTVAFEMNNCTISGSCFNDIPPTGITKNVPNISSTKDKVNKLTKVGQYTDVFASESGWIGIAQLKSQTPGSYGSWDQFLQTYKKQYAPQITYREAIQNNLALAGQSVVRRYGIIVHKIAITIAPKVYATRIICQGFDPGDNLTKHYANIAYKARDYVTGAFIGGIDIKESRAVGGCPNKFGNYVDDADSPNIGTTKNGVAWTSSSGNQYNLIFYDNCWNQPPYMTVGKAPNGYTFMTDGSSFLSSPGFTDKITSDPPNSSLDSDLITQWVGHAGSVNAGDGESIDLEYMPAISWHLDPNSYPATGSYNSYTFTHNVQNLPTSKSKATYDWRIYHQTPGASSYTPTGGLSWTDGTCTKIAPGNYCPTKSFTSHPYSFPASATPGQKYCERIQATDADGPGTPARHSSGVCVTKPNNVIDVCPNIAGNQATIPAGMIKDSAGNCVTPPPPPPASQVTTCYDTRINIPATFTGSYNGSVSGTYKARAMTYAVSQNPGNGVVARSGGTPYDTTQGWVYANGPATKDYTFWPDGTGVGTWTIFQARARHDTQVQTGTKNGQPVYTTVTTWQWDNVISAPDSANCYSATCSNVTVDAAPNSFVKAGQVYNVSVDLNNTSPQNAKSVGWLLDYLYGGNSGSGPRLGLWISTTPGIATTNIVGTSLGAGGSATVTFQVTAQPGAHFESSQFQPAYIGGGGFQLGPNCSGPSVDVYTPFNFTVSSTGQLLPDNENPSSFNYSAQICNNLSNVAVNGSVSSDANATLLSGAASIASYSGGTYNPGCTTVISGNPSVPLPGKPVPAAGDKYCSNITVSGYNQGFVGGGGPGDLQGTQMVNPPQPSASACSYILNEPYIHAFGSDVFAGGGFGPTCSPSTGGINTYLRTTGLRPVGSGVQIGALAIGPIKGFSSAILRGTPPVGSYGLTLANSGLGAVSGPGAPSLGGNLGGTLCSPDYFTTAMPEGTTSQANNTASANRPNNTGARVSNTEFYTPTGGTLTLSAGNIDDYTNVAIFVKGNVHITGGNAIKYTNNSWAGNNDAIEKIPSFQLFVEGNIYIDPGITQLDGQYIAQPVTGAPAGTTGNIYTCSNASGTAGLDTSNSDLLSTCHNQLVINGTFVAQKVYLERAYGSLRNSAAGEMLSPGTNKDCGPENGISPLGDCSAEIFNFSPELYLAQPATKAHSGPTSGKYDYFTSLSPVL